MAKKVQKKKTAPKPAAVPRPKDFLDMAAPSVVKFNTDCAIIGGAYHTFLSLRGYAASTEELALLSRLGAKDGVNLSVYARQVTPAEEKQIIQNASNKNRLTRSNTNDLQQSVAAESDLQDVAALVTQRHRNGEPLIHCAVFIDISAPDMAKLSTLKDFVTAELARSKLTPDPLLLRQREGFQAANPAGFNAFGSQFERVLPAGSAANLYPFNYSGKTDPQGFYVGRDRYGSNVIVDLDRRAEDKTTASVLILGNSGQGKSYLLKLLLCNILESGKSVICLDPEHELIDLCANLGGCFVDLMDGRYRINPLEPKAWSVDNEDDDNAPATFRQRTLLSQHISFLKDFFRSHGAAASFILLVLLLGQDLFLLREFVQEPLREHLGGGLPQGIRVGGLGGLVKAEHFVIAQRGPGKNMPQDHGLTHPAAVATIISVHTAVPPLFVENLRTGIAIGNPLMLSPDFPPL